MAPTERTDGDDETETLEPADPTQQFGAAAADDAELADRVSDAADDPGAAEAEFDRRSRGPVPTAKEETEAGGAAR